MTKRNSILLLGVYVIFLFAFVCDVTAFSSSTPYTQVASMPGPREYVECFVHGDYIYCFHGLSGPDISLIEHEVFRYDVLSDSWEVYDTVPFAGWAAYSALIGDKVYFAGGGISAIAWFKDSVFSYNIITKQTDTLFALPEPLISGRAFNNDGKFHLLGGHNGSSPYNANYIYDPVSDVWASLPFLPSGLERHCVVQFDTLVYLIGGRGLGGVPTSNINLEYNTNSHTFTNRANLMVRVKDAACAVFDGKVYVFGGRDASNSLTDVVQIFDPLLNTWSSGTSLPSPIAHAAAVTYCDAIYLIGGFDGSVASDQVFRYLPESSSNCCINRRGDFNLDCVDANILDLTFIVDFIFRGSGDPGYCPEESDVNSDGSGPDILDLTFLVDRIFRGGAAPAACP